MEDQPLMRGAPMGERGTKRVSAGDILTLLRHHDIPCSIDSFAAKGWTARLGDPTGGFYAQQSRFNTLAAAASWLLEEALRHYPATMRGGASER
jgi:hypothetical protein